MKKLILSILLICLSSPAFAGGWTTYETTQPLFYKTVAAAATTLIKSGYGILHTIVVTGGVAGTIIVYDSTTGAGTQIANYSSTNAAQTYLFDSQFTSGCTVVTGAATNLTVTYL